MPNNIFDFFFKLLIIIAIVFIIYLFLSAVDGSMTLKEHMIDSMVESRQETNQINKK